MTKIASNSPSTTPLASRIRSPSVDGSNMIRIVLRAPRRTDRDAIVDLVRRSGQLHRPWVYPPSTRAAVDAWIARAARDDATCSLLACLRADGRIAGIFNISQIFRGGFCSAYLGFYAAIEFAGQGYMTEALARLLRHAFVALRLHRLEANVQSANAASRALVERCGFRLEGFSPRYLKVGRRWRDHERWAITVEDWRSARRKSVVGAMRGAGGRSRRSPPSP
jgi:[ribosomal protein S5]-alanine N-acetyltransferase